MSPRLATKDDVPALRRLAQICFNPYIQLMGRMPAPGLEDFCAPVAAGHVHIWGQPIQAYMIAYAKPPGFLIDALAVAPDQQGRGRGQQMLAKAETLASQQGHQRVWLYAHECMTINIELYQRQGYKVFDRRREDGFDRVFLSKDLS